MPRENRAQSDEQKRDHVIPEKKRQKTSSTVPARSRESAESISSVSRKSRRSQPSGHTSMPHENRAQSFEQMLAGQREATIRFEQDLCRGRPRMQDWEYERLLTRYGQDLEAARTIREEVQSGRRTLDDNDARKLRAFERATQEGYARVVAARRGDERGRVQMEEESHVDARRLAWESLRRWEKVIGMAFLEQLTSSLLESNL